MIAGIALIMGMSALPLFAWSTVPEYWGRLFLIWGIGFLFLICAFSFVTSRKAAQQPVKKLSTGRLFFNGCAAWAFSFLVLAVVIFSPLCLGQDNGDGTNDFSLCIVYTLIWPLFMSVQIVPLIFLTSWVSSMLWSLKLSRANRLNSQ